MASSDELDQKFVFLRGGFITPTPAYLLLLELERRGFQVSAEGRDGLRIVPVDRLTPADCMAIRTWKRHLLNLIAYCQRPGLDAHLFADTDRPC